MLGEFYVYTFSIEMIFTVYGAFGQMQSFFVP